MDFYELAYHLARNPLPIHEQQVLDYLRSLPEEQFSMVRPVDVAEGVGFSAKEVCRAMDGLSAKGIIQLRHTAPQRPRLTLVKPKQGRGGTHAQSGKSPS